MGLICGWLGKTSADPETTIYQMLLSAKGYTHCAQVVCGSKNGAIGVRGANDASPLNFHDEIYAVIEGNPTWEDSLLSKLSSESSSSHALAEGFKRYGVNVLDKLHGEFALCVMKPDEHYLLIAVDRVGIRPLAYTSINNSFVFASQIDSILAHPFVKAEIDPQGIFNYFYFHMVPSPGTIYRDIWKLQPGECVESMNGLIKRRFYWRLEYTEENKCEQEFSEQLLYELKQSVSNCLLDKPTGSFLSGGLDSSSITGIFQSLSKEPIDAFSIGFKADGFDEMSFARESAKHFGVSLHEYYVTPQDVVDAVSLIANAYDEPFGNASAIPTYYCAKLAREQGKTLLLAGDGGDEIFAGNERYAKQKIFDLYQHIPKILKNLLIEPAATYLPPLKKLRSYIEQAKTPMPERMETYNFLHRSALTDIFSMEYLDQIDPGVPLTLLNEHYQRSEDNVHLVKKMLFLDHKFTLADNDLRKVNRMCELAGIDVRYPMLQERMMLFAAEIPADMLLRRFELRTLYRRAMKDFLARETLNKSKHGFGLPFGLWMNEYQPLNELAHEKLKQIRLRGILNTQYIDNIIEAQKTGHATYYGVFIWILVMLEQWLETHGQ